MRIFGFDIRLAPPADEPKKEKQYGLQTVSGSGGWWPIIREYVTGAFQRNLEINRQDVLTYSTVWACVTLIAADIAKIWLDLMKIDENGISTPTENPAYSPVLRRPNHYQTRVKFFEHWIISKLVHGNTYVLKRRDRRGVVDALYVLDPQRVHVLVAPDGSVFYDLGQDNLSGLEESITVPAREIIHDIMVPLFHPLVGVSPIFACGLAAMQGLKILNSSSRLFGRGSLISGVLTAPGSISPETAKRLEDYWNANYAGEENAGKVAALGDGLEFKPMTMTAVDAELVAQLKLTDERICATFHVPGYMVGIGPAPPYTDIQSINLQYYTQALQNPIENLEELLVKGLELPRDLSIQFDVEALARMDTKTQVESAVASVNGGISAPNEARAKFDLKPMPGGDQPFLQQQYWPLRQLAERQTPVPTGPAPTSTDDPPKAKPKPAKTLAADFALAVQRKCVEHQLYDAA